MDKKKKDGDEKESDKTETASNEESGEEEEESFDQWLRRQAAEAKKEAEKHSKRDAMTQQKLKHEQRPAEQRPAADIKPIAANVKFHNFIEALKADQLAENVSYCFSPNSLTSFQVHMFHLPIPVLSFNDAPNCEEVGCDGNIEEPSDKVYLP
jgi:hypothetical protein